MFTIEELEKVMKKHGAVICAVPETAIEVYDLAMKDRVPGGRVVYMEKYGKECVVREFVPVHAGQFRVEIRKKPGNTVQFVGGYYDTLEDVAQALENGEVISPVYKDREKGDISCGTR